MRDADDHQGALEAVSTEMDAIRYVLGDLAGLSSDPHFSPVAINRLYNRYTTRHAHLHACWLRLTDEAATPVRVQVLAGGGLSDTGSLLAMADRPLVSERPRLHEVR